MTQFLVYFAFILIIIAIGYLIRINVLAESIREKRSAEVIEKEKKGVARVFLGMLLFYMIMVIWNYYRNRA